MYVSGGTLTLIGSTMANNQAFGGQGGPGGRGGTGGMGSLGSIFGSGSGGGALPLGGSGGSGGSGGWGYGGALYLAGGTVIFNADTLSANAAEGGSGGSGGIGGNGGFAGGLSFSGGSSNPTAGIAWLPNGRRRGGPAARGDTGVGNGGIPQITFPSSGSGGGGIASGGIGGNGGDGGNGQGGAIYVAGGTLTLYNVTVAENSVQGGTGGTGGKGGKGGSLGLGNGASGSVGSPGDSDGGGLYVNGGTVDLYNSTVALNSQIGTGSGGGGVQAAGTVKAVSTLFAGNGAVDFSGNIDATNSLFQASPVNGTVTGSNNLIGVDPLLDTAGLASNGGPTQTIALQSGSPALGAGSNPTNLFTDQRGYDSRTGPNGTDIGAYQHDATADTTAPTATLVAPGVTSSNASALNPYTFTVTYADNVAISMSSLPGAVVSVLPPGGGAAIAATAISMQANGTTDPFGNAQGFVITYEITPPGGAWSSSDNGTYQVSLGGTPVTDLSGNAVATGTMGTFSVNISSTTAIFLGKDTTTQGSWIATYGFQGYDVIGNSSSLPSYASVMPQGQSNYTWTTTSTNPAALQNASGPYRTAAVWFSTTTFSIGVNLTDGQAHDLEVYADDYDNKGRSEQVQVVSAATGAVLDTETISSFTGGVYLDWEVTGNVIIEVSRLAGLNAVINGVFLDPPAGTPPLASASFLKQDTATQGSWIATYGFQGYDVVADASSLPSYASVTPQSQFNYTWTTNSTNPAALQNASGPYRTAAVWFSTTTFSIGVNLTDGQAHDLEVYADDYDNKGRSEQVQVVSAATGAVLDTEMISSFTGGVYLDWAVTGDVIIKVTRISGPNAVINGVFLDPPAGTPPLASASFLEKDTTTQGNWIGAYGSKGYVVIADASKLPAYASVTPQSQFNYTWTTNSTNPAALQNVSGSGRTAAVWFSTTTFTIDVNLTDGQAHDLEVYADDYDNKGAASRCRSSAPRRGRFWTPKRSRPSRGASTWTGW